MGTIGSSSTFFWQGHGYEHHSSDTEAATSAIVHAKVGSPWPCGGIDHVENVGSKQLQEHMCMYVCIYIYIYIYIHIYIYICCTSSNLLTDKRGLAEENVVYNTNSIISIALLHYSIIIDELISQKYIISDYII